MTKPIYKCGSIRGNIEIPFTDDWQRDDMIRADIISYWIRSADLFKVFSKIRYDPHDEFKFTGDPNYSYQLSSVREFENKVRNKLQYNDTLRAARTAILHSKESSKYGYTVNSGLSTSYTGD